MAQKPVLAAVALVVLAACTPRAAVVTAPPPRAAEAPPAPLVEAPPAAPAEAPPPEAPRQASASLDDYKRRFAGRILATSGEIFRDPLPRVMKSIVVLYIRVDPLGRPLDVSVFRSNGYRSLERRALESVVDAMPLPAPPPALLDDQGSLGFLETFLFRDDDRFQVRSLVGEARQARAASASR